MAGSGSQTEARLKKQAAQLQLASAAVSLIMVAWCLIPEDQRQRAAARARRAARPLLVPLLGAAARLVAQAAMTRELATGTASYTLSERLSRARDRWAEGDSR
jgi:hypothetical protein